MRSRPRRGRPDMPLSLCVVTPSYNQGRYIERTIRSVLDQDYPGLEYAVIDGGSTDGTLEILKRYASSLKWVSERDNGQADAVNRGIRETSGEIIGWLNSDDVYSPGAFAAAARAFAENPAADVIYGAANHIDEADRVIEPYPTEPWNLERLSEFCFICQPAVFLRRSAISRWGLLDEGLNYCMDYEYWIRLGRGGARFLFVPEVLAGSRFHPDTKTLGARVAVHAEINLMLRQRLGKTPARWLFNYAGVLAEDWGVRRIGRVPHIFVVALLSFYAGLRWNHGISLEMLRVLRRDYRRALQAIWSKPR